MLPSTNQQDADSAYSTERLPFILQKIDHLLQIERFDLAEQDLKRHLQNDPENPELRGRYGFLHLKTNRLDDAERIFRDILRTMPSSSSAKRLLAVTIITTDPRESERLFLEVLHQNVYDMDALHDYAFLLMKSGQPTKAQAILQHVIRMAPDFTNAHITMAAVSTNQNQHELANSHAQRAIATDPEEARAYLVSAITEYRAGRFVSAYQLAFESLRNDPTSKQAESILVESDRLARWPMIPIAFWRRCGPVGRTILAILCAVLFFAAIQMIARSGDGAKWMCYPLALAYVSFPFVSRQLARWCCKLWPRRPDGSTEY